jgi:hypothetical protein
LKPGRAVGWVWGEHTLNPNSRDDLGKLSILRRRRRSSGGRRGKGGGSLGAGVIGNQARERERWLEVRRGFTTENHAACEGVGSLEEVRGSPWGGDGQGIGARGAGLC